MDPAAYNYAHFDEHIAEAGDAAALASFRECLHVGQRAANVDLTRLDDGASVRLSDLWGSQPAVVEFGSFT